MALSLSLNFVKLLTSPIHHFYRNGHYGNVDYDKGNKKLMSEGNGVLKRHLWTE